MLRNWLNCAASTVELAKRSVYQPPRSTDILLQEFIARGPNDADVATVYESIALYRWKQAKVTQGKPYQIYYLEPTIETVSTAVVVRRYVSAGTAKAAQEFIDFLRASEQQAVFVKYGFRPVESNVDLEAVPGSPWSQDIPGAQVEPPSDPLPMPEESVLGEIQKLWERAQ